MNKKSLKGLLYSDYCLTKKVIYSNLIFIGIFIFLLGLVNLSVKYGNLKLLLDSFVEEDRESFINNIYMAGKFIPATFFLAISNVGADISIKEVKPKWKKYRMSLPITPKRYAFGKHLYILILNLGGGILAAAYMFIYSAVISGQQNRMDYVYLTMIMCGLTTFSIFFVDLILLVKSVDTAGIIFTIFMVVIIAVMGFVSNNGTDVIETLSNKVIHFSPNNWWMLVIYYVLINIIGYVISVMIYSRRDA